MRDNKGQMTMIMVVLLVALLLTLVLLLVGGIIVVKVNDALSLDIDLGQVNLKNETDKTIGQYTTMYVNSADWWGIALIFGMILGLFLSAYFTRNSFPKWGIILDIFVIIAVFIVSIYLSSAYSTLLDALASAGETFLEDSTPKTSMFMLNLPVFIVIIGVIMMVLFHASIPRRTEERIQEGGFLRGV